MDAEIKNLVKYIKCNSIKSADEIIGMFIRASKQNNLDCCFRFGRGKIFKYTYLGYLTKKEYKLLKSKNLFGFISRSGSSYVHSHNYSFRISDHWGQLSKHRNSFFIDILDQSGYKNNYGMTTGFDDMKVFLVGVLERKKDSSNYIK